MIVRQTTPEEKRRTDELFAIAFEYPMEEEAPQDQAEEETLHRWAAFDEETGEMMSLLMVTDFRMNFDGQSCLMGGMGGAATLPQYRRKGGIRGCFEAILPWMYENGYDFSYLYPFSTAYYRKFGYECGVQYLNVKLHLPLLRPGSDSGYFLLCEKNRPMTESIRAVDQAVEPRFNGMICHDEAFYDWTKKPDPAKQQEFTYVCFSDDGTPKAYTTFRKQDQPDGRNLVCSRFQFIDREGFGILMQLFKSLSTDHMYAKFRLPANCGMEYLFPEWSLGAVEMRVQDAGMIRVVNVESALQKASCTGSGKVILKVTDAQIPENSGTWRVLFADGKVLSVSRTAAMPDAELDIHALSALLFGSIDLDAAVRYLPGVTVCNPDAPLGSLLHRKDLHIVDYF